MCGLGLAIFAWVVNEAGVRPTNGRRCDFLNLDMRKFICFVFLPLLHGAEPAPCTTPQACWDLLAKGNQNWVDGRLRHPNSTPARRIEVKDHQSPFAVILSCSDSRVPPEVVFDRGVGDLFVIRVAGNVVDDFGLGSIQYAVAVHKYTKLVVVLGHQRCGAAEAAVQKAKLPEPLAKLVEALRPAVEASAHWPGDPVENTVDANVDLMVKKLSDTFKADGVVVIGKRYSLDSGKVTDPKPLTK